MTQEMGEGPVRTTCCLADYIAIHRLFCTAMLRR